MFYASACNRPIASESLLEVFDCPFGVHLLGQPDRFDPTEPVDPVVQEVSAQRSVSIGDQTVDVEPSFLVKAQTARVKLMSAFGKDRVKAQLVSAMRDRVGAAAWAQPPQPTPLGHDGRP